MTLVRGAALSALTEMLQKVSWVSTGWRFKLLATCCTFPGTLQERISAALWVQTEDCRAAQCLHLLDFKPELSL